MRVAWNGYGGHAHMAERLRPMIEELGMELVTIHEHRGNPKYPDADILWDRSTYVKELQKADIIILPTNHEKWPAKSPNKLTQALSLGKPVICGPQDSYKAVAEKYPGCCLFADDDAGWKSALESLKDEAVRSRLSKEALKAANDYSLDSIGEKWAQCLTERTGCVDVVIPTYNNLPCLKLCVDSIRECTQVPYKIIVVNNGPDEKVHEYLSAQKDIKYIKKGRLKFAQAVNIGIRAGDSEYVMILNDDTIVSRGWLRKMIKATRDHPEFGAVGPLSNCDKGWLHNMDIRVGGVDLLPGQNTIEQIKPIIPQIYDYVHPGADYTHHEWIALYCTLIPRKVVDEVGHLDEKFTNSGEDTDYMRRIRKMGYKVICHKRVFVFHFGAVGRKILESEDPGSYQAADRATQSYLKEKWGRQTVVIYSGPSWERWDFRSVDKGGIGGSETWAVELARALARLNYRVKVFCDCPEQGIMDGDIEYLHYGSWWDWVDQNWIDHLISSRTTDSLSRQVRAGKVYVIIHDIWISRDKAVPNMDKVDRFCVLSDWHRDFVRDHHGIPEKKLMMTSNGLDFSRFDDVNVQREPYRLVYSSSPDRGLDTLLYLFDFIKAEIPEAELHIFYGFENWQKSVMQRGDKAQLKKMEELKAAMKKPGVVYHGRVGQRELAEEFKKSSLWAYATNFTESFCITALEAQRAGVPVVASNYAGLRTTVGDSGILVGSGQEGASYTKAYREEFLARCLEVLQDNTVWTEWSRRGFRNTEKYSWDEVAKRWKEEFDERVT